MIRGVSGVFGVFRGFSGFSGFFPFFRVFPIFSGFGLIFSIFGVLGSGSDRDRNPGFPGSNPDRIRSEKIEIFCRSFKFCSSWLITRTVADLEIHRYPWSYSTADKKCMIKNVLEMILSFPRAGGPPKLLYTGDGAGD